MSKESFVLGLTGSIGMGKSTTARMFEEEGIPVWDADAAVQRLYSAGGAAVAPIGAICPQAVTGGAVNKAALKDWIERDETALEQIERAVHPLVAADRESFLAETTAPIVVVDIPLLFETGAEKQVDATIVVTAPADVQRARVLARPGMTPEQFDRILAKQIPDREKRKRADYVVETLNMDDARAAVRAIVREIRERISDA